MIQVDPFPIESFKEIVKELQESPRSYTDLEEDVVLDDNWPSAQAPQELGQTGLGVPAIQQLGPQPVPVRHTTKDYIDLTNGKVDGAKIEHILAMLLKRAKLSKNELARMMKVNRASLQPFYRSQRKNGMGVKSLVHMVKAAGGRLLVELPDEPK